MNEPNRRLPKGQTREHDTFFGEKLPPKSLPQPREHEPKVWLNCFWMIAPLFFTVVSTFQTGLPLAMVLVIPGTLGGFINWLLSSTPARKQIWRSVFIGCLASWFFLGVLASQWP